MIDNQVNCNKNFRWTDCSIAPGEAMRCILVENARRKKRLELGGNLRRVDIEEMDLAAPLPDDDLLALDEALTRLAEFDPRAAEVVKPCFFVELTQEQTAKERGVLRGEKISGNFAYR